VSHKQNQELLHLSFKTILTLTASIVIDVTQIVVE